MIAVIATIVNIEPNSSLVIVVATIVEELFAAIIWKPAQFLDYGLLLTYNCLGHALNVNKHRLTDCFSLSEFQLSLDRVCTIKTLRKCNVFTVFGIRKLG